MYQKDHRIWDEPVGRFMAECSTQETWVIFGRFGEMPNVKTALKRDKYMSLQVTQSAAIILRFCCLNSWTLEQEWIILGQLYILQVCYNTITLQQFWWIFLSILALVPSKYCGETLQKVKRSNGVWGYNIKPHWRLCISFPQNLVLRYLGGIFYTWLIPEICNEKSPYE